jgi:hypothetical protein
MIRLLGIIIQVSRLRSWKIKLEFGGAIQFICWMAFLFCYVLAVLFAAFGHASTLLRYRFPLFHSFWARKHPLALPVSAFLLFLGTQAPSCVTGFRFFALFGHASTLLRYRFSLFCSFWASKHPLALPVFAFSLFLGTQAPSCVTGFHFFALFGQRRTILMPLLTHLFMYLTQKSKP